MKPGPFIYHDPRTLPEALALLGDLDNVKVLAGGQSLMPMMNMRYAMPDHLVDLNLVEGLAGVTQEDGRLRIGSMTRQRDLEVSADVATAFPLLREALRHVGHRQTRNRGTIGGSLCHLDPAAELAAVCLAAGADLHVAGTGGERDRRHDGFSARLHDACDQAGRDRRPASTCQAGRRAMVLRSRSSPAARATSPLSASPCCSPRTRPARSYAPPLRCVALPIGRAGARPRKHC